MCSWLRCHCLHQLSDFAASKRLEVATYSVFQPRACYGWGFAAPPCGCALLCQQASTAVASLVSRGQRNELRAERVTDRDCMPDRTHETAPNSAPKAKREITSIVSHSKPCASKQASTRETREHGRLHDITHCVSGTASLVKFRGCVKPYLVHVDRCIRAELRQNIQELRACVGGNLEARPAAHIQSMLMVRADDALARDGNQPSLRLLGAVPRPNCALLTVSLRP